jgi:hypothetical protein
VVADLEEVLMPRETDRAVGMRLSCVLDGLLFPAAKWQIVTHAEYYGADARSIAQLWAIPVRSYADVAAVTEEIVPARLPRATTARQRARGRAARHRLRMHPVDSADGAAERLSRA